MTPNPTALRSLVTDEDVDAHRCVSCAEYDDCLDAALRKCWRSWTCARCKLFLAARHGAAAHALPVAAVRGLAPRVARSHA